MKDYTTGAPSRVSASRSSWRVVLGVAHPTTRVQIARDLRDVGCRVSSASSGTGLLHKLGRAISDDDATRRPALIIADLKLAGCSGLSVLEGTRNLLWDTPFFLLVEHHSESIARLAFTLGAARVFQMPRDRGDVSAAALTCLLARSQRHAANINRRA